MQSIQNKQNISITQVALYNKLIHELKKYIHLLKPDTDEGSVLRLNVL